MSADDPRFDEGANRYDALLVVSFGGPEGMADVMPFLDNVLRGLNLPDIAKRRIAARYEQFGGVSPINARTRELIEAIRGELDRRGPALPIYWGNRNWHPMLADTLRRMEADGVERALAFMTNVFSSYSGCRKYRENLYEAAAPLARPPRIDRLRFGYNHPGFIEAMGGQVRAAFDRLPEARRAAARLVFTAHSLPESMARGANYEHQLREACRLVADAISVDGWRLAWQSRNASYGGEAWLGPSLEEALTEERERGARDAVIAPIGFVSDHMEVVLDLDLEARAHADVIGLHLERAETPGSHPAFAGMVRDLVEERMTANPERPALGNDGPGHDLCPADCCLPGRPGALAPTLCGVPDNSPS